MHPDDLSALQYASQDRSRTVEVAVTGCAYACCGRGWMRRDGYEQRYHGYVENLTLPANEHQVGTFMLYSLGLGAISYVVAVRFPEVQDVQGQW